jgi:hypothetical protein
MRVIWNGEALENFSPSRGIRQGDSISPLIFVLCMAGAELGMGRVGPRPAPEFLILIVYMYPFVNYLGIYTSKRFIISK